MEKIRQRKEYKHGERTQTMICFRCDNENLSWLQSQPNRGRTINNLIAAARKEEEKVE